MAKALPGTKPGTCTAPVYQQSSQLLLHQGLQLTPVMLEARSCKPHLGSGHTVAPTSLGTQVTHQPQCPAHLSSSISRM